MESILLVY